MKCRVSRLGTGIASALALFALSAPASALIIEYNQIVTGAIPDSPAPWLTTTITNVAGGVDIKLEPGIDEPEFLTSIFFSLAGDYTLSDPGVDDPDYQSCSGKVPAGTGPWQLCFAFDSGLHWNTSDGSATFFMSGLSESNFVYNLEGWISVAHVQGIQPNCSSWVGSYSSDGGVTPSNDGVCTDDPPTNVPEPATLGLFGLGLLAFGVARKRRI